MYRFLPIITVYLLLLVSCARHQASWDERYPEYAAHYQPMIQAYCGSDVHAAESALQDWAQFIKSYRSDLNPNPDLIITYYRLYLLKQHAGDNTAAEQYLELSMDYTHKWKDSIGMTNAMTREQLLTSMKRADEKLSVQWKGVP
jgi:hypothetical protein